MRRTEKQLAGAQRRTLRTIRARLLALADAWDGIDEFNRSELTDLADRAEKVAAQMIEEVPE